LSHETDQTPESRAPHRACGTGRRTHVTGRDQARAALQRGKRERAERWLRTWGDVDGQLGLFQLGASAPGDIPTPRDAHDSTREDSAS
jgi:hypothetical protein